LTDHLFDALSAGRLRWLPEAGVGFYECEGAPYDAAYFERYRAMAETPVAVALNAFRVGLVERYAPPLADGVSVLDVGIGDGAFLRAADQATPGLEFCGFDVNPAGIGYLWERGLWGDIADPDGWDVLTFWDSLEHIRDPRPALAAAKHLAIVSIPTFRDESHVLASRHYRKDEHYWYFTRAGFIAFAVSQGFEVVDILATETAIGREDIETFVLRRDSRHSPAEIEGATA
jgi:hypothetical protein